MGCGVGKTPVGRGQCAPPLGGQYVSAAAHMGAALQGHIKGCGETGRRGNRRSAAGGGRSEPVSRKCPDWRPRQWAIAAPYGSMVRNAAQAGGVEPRPYAGQDDFRKNVIPRSEATWESVFPVWQGCGVGVLRIATPACGLVRNDMSFGRRGMSGAAGNDFQRLTFVLDSDRIGATNFAPREVLV